MESRKKKKNILMRSFEILSGISKKKSQREKKENAKYFRQG
jgi:hypothetical protein